MTGNPMHLNPFLAVLLILLGVLSAMFGNRLLRSASSSESQSELRAGYWCFIGGLTTVMTVFIFDPTAVFQAVPEFSNFVRDFLTA
jgi:hypothetical protein